MEPTLAMALFGHRRKPAGGADAAKTAAVAWDEGAPDETLLDAFAAGDGRAFEALVRRHQRAVLGLCLRLVKDADAAEDLAQRAFLRALDGLPEFRGDSSFRSWVLRIAVNLARNHVRDHARFEALPEGAEAEVPAASADPAERVELERKRALLRKAVDELPPRQREVLLLRIDGELPFAEIAKALSITENNAKVNFHLAVKRLRGLLGAGEAG